MASPSEPPASEVPHKHAARPDWAALYGRHRESMLRVSADRLRLAGRDTDQAQDIVQKVFSEVMKRSPEAVENWEAYLVRATVNRTRDHLSAAEAQHAFPVGVTETDQDGDLLDRAADDNVEEQTLLRLRSQRLCHRTKEVLADLPDDQQQVLNGRLFNGLTNVQIAPTLGVTPQRVSQLWRAGFSTLMSAFGDDPDIWPGDEEGNTGD